MTAPLSKSGRALLDAARKLFWKHGINRVTVEGIVAAAGVSKMTFYRNFNNKEEVARLLLGEMLDHNDKKYAALLEQDKPLPQRFREVMEMKVADSRGVGDHFLEDLQHLDDPTLHQMLSENQRKWRELLAHYLYESIGKAELSGTTNIEFIFYMIDEVTRLMQEEAMISMYPEPDDRIRALTQFLFFGISGPINLPAR